MCLNIWGMNSGPYMQALHFSFGVGAFVAPLIAEPFLAHVDLNATNYTEAQTWDLVHFNPAQKPPLDGVDPGNRAARETRSAPWDFRASQTGEDLSFLHPVLQSLDSQKELSRNRKRNTSVEHSGKSVGSWASRLKRDTTSENGGNGDSDFNPSASLVPNNQSDTPVHRPISTGVHLSSSSKIADGSSVGKEISKIEQNKQKEVKTNEAAKEEQKEPEPENPPTENNETAANANEEKPVEIPKTTTTTTTTTTVATTTTTTTTKAPPTTTPVPDQPLPAVVMGNFTIESDAPPTTPQPNSTANHIKTVIKQKVNKVIEYVNRMPDIMSEFTKVQFSFLIIAAILFVTSLLFMCLCCCAARTGRSLPGEALSEDYVIHKESRGFRVQILILLFIFYFLYVGMEVTYGGLIMTFSVKYLDWSKSEGTMLTSVFWGSFAVGRGLAIFLAKCLSPAIMLIVDLVLSCLALGGLVMALDSNHFVLWLCTAMLGVGMASIFPTGITWAERYMRVTGKATAVFVVGSALGEMALPALTGFLFQSAGAMWLMYVLLGCGIVSAVIYIIMQNLATNKGERYVPRMRRRGGSGASRSASGRHLVNGVMSPDDDDPDDPDLEMESVLSDNVSETSASGGGVVRKKTVFTEESDALISNGSARRNCVRAKRKHRGRGVSYKRI